MSDKDPIRLFVGADNREAVGLHVFLQSLVETTPHVSVEFLGGEQADGSNRFTYERYRVPERCGWKGRAIFLDASDMLLRANLRELYDLFDPHCAVQVVKHDYRTKHPRKYLGTDMESVNVDYPRKNWSSVILWNCAHLSHLHAQDKLRGIDGSFLHRFAWLEDDLIGELPSAWNHLVGEQEYDRDAKLAHFTLGIPGFQSYRAADYSEEWWDTFDRSQRGLQPARTITSER
jgi:hypothetical protein